MTLVRSQGVYQVGEDIYVTTALDHRDPDAPVALRVDHDGGEDGYLLWMSLDELEGIVHRLSSVLRVAKQAIGKQDFPG